MDATTLNILKLLPFAALIVIVIVVILRGLGRKGDDTNNRGGSDHTGAGGLD